MPHRIREGCLLLSALLLAACSAVTGAPAKGSEDAVDQEDAAAMKAIGAKVTGTIVWSSSRLGNHDLFTMKKPPFTVSAIAGLTQDADLDPSLAMRDLGYRPIGVREGFRRCFPVPPRTATTDRYLRTRSHDDAAPNP